MMVWFMKTKILQKLNEYEIQDQDILNQYIDYCFERLLKKEGVEAHHILPKAQFSEYADLKERQWNRSYLSPSEHLIAHYILCLASTELSGGFVSLSKYRGNLSDISNENYDKAIKIAYEEKNRKISKTKSDPKWKESVSVEQSRKTSEKLNDKEWKDTIGVVRKINFIKSLMRKEIPICPHCGKIGKSGASWSNMKRWHFDNCKYIKGVTA